MMEERRPAVELQERDFTILRDLYECRVMTLRHICELHFEGRMEAAKKRIQKLKNAGFVRERTRAVGEPSVLHLSKTALPALQRSGRLEIYPAMPLAAMERRAQVSDLTLRHELEVMDVRTSFLKALAEHDGISATQFSTWPVLYQFTAQHVSLPLGRRELLMRPDGFISVREEENGEVYEHLFFLEVDRSTEVLDIIAQKAACYLDFYQRGGMAERFGASRAELRNFPFRVLIIVQNEERRNNAAEHLLRNTPPIMSLVWLCTMAEFLESPLDRIWLRPLDYLEATRGTTFDPIRRANSTIYRRQNEREQKVRSTVEHQMLFAGNSSKRHDAAM